MPLAPQVEPSPCADSPACRCSGRMVTLPTRPQPAGLWSGMEGGALGCTPSLPALWVQVAAGSCVLQLCVLVFGEKCLVQGSAGSLGTLTLTRSGCQLWESRGCRSSPRRPPGGAGVHQLSPKAPWSGGWGWG